MKLERRIIHTMETRFLYLEFRKVGNDISMNGDENIFKSIFNGDKAMIVKDGDELRNFDFELKDCDELIDTTCQIFVQKTGEIYSFKGKFFNDILTLKFESKDSELVIELDIVVDEYTGDVSFK